MFEQLTSSSSSSSVLSVQVGIHFGKNSSSSSSVGGQQQAKADGNNCNNNVKKARRASGVELTKSQVGRWHACLLPRMHAVSVSIYLPPLTTVLLASVFPNTGADDSE